MTGLTGSGKQLPGSTVCGAGCLRWRRGMGVGGGGSGGGDGVDGLWKTAPQQQPRGGVTGLTGFGKAAQPLAAPPKKPFPLSSQPPAPSEKVVNLVTPLWPAQEASRCNEMPYFRRLVHPVTPRWLALCGAWLTGLTGTREQPWGVTSCAVTLCHKSRMSVGDDETEERVHTNVSRYI